MSMMKEFWENARMPRGANSSFITFIPKKENAQGLDEDRPITLICCIYKVISKVLAKRVKRVLGKVIDMRQSVFLRGGRWCTRSK